MSMKMMMRGKDVMMMIFPLIKDVIFVIWIFRSRPLRSDANSISLRGDKMEGWETLGQDRVFYILKLGFPHH